MIKVFKRISTAFFIRMAGFFILYPTAVLLARLLGAEQYGVYGFVLAVVNICLVIPVFGFDQLIVKLIGKHVKDGGVVEHQPESAFLVKFCWVFSLLTGIVLFVSLITLFWSKGSDFFNLQSANIIAVCLGMLLLPIMALRKIFSSTLRATHNTFYAQFSDELVQPLIFFCCIILLFLFNNQPLLFSVMLIQVVAYTCSLLFSIYHSKTKIKALYNKPTFGQFEYRTWLMMGVPMMMLAGLHNLATYLDRIMIGIFLDSESVGYYLVAARNATLILIVSSVCCGVTNPIIAREYANKKFDELKKLIAFQTTLSVLSGIVFLIVFVFLSEWILSLFGDAFVVAESALLIISIGYFSFMLFGGATEMLFMTGHQWVATRIVICTTLTNIALNLILIPWLGIAGAAIATAISETLKGGVASYCVYRSLGVNTTIVSGLGLLKQYTKSMRYSK